MNIFSDTDQMLSFKIDRKTSILSTNHTVIIALTVSLIVNRICYQLAHWLILNKNLQPLPPPDTPWHLAPRPKDWGYPCCCPTLHLATGSQQYEEQLPCLAYRWPYHHSHTNSIIPRNLKILSVKIWNFKFPHYHSEIILWILHSTCVLYSFLVMILTVRINR